MRHAAVVAIFSLAVWFLVGCLAMSYGYVVAAIASSMWGAVALFVATCHHRRKLIPLRLRSSNQLVRRNR